MARKIALADLMTDEEAVGLVRRLRFLLGGVGKPAALSDILERLRREHRAKRNFVALLDTMVREANRS